MMVAGVVECMNTWMFIGYVRYAKSRKDTAQMKTALYSICYGCNSTFAAFSRHPEEFSHIKALGWIAACIDRYYDGTTVQQPRY
ncbi:hypothetical protein MP478_00640 [Chryseobacterium sp. WG14]|uniref:hypothetical protein n=1 Tax=Chryseobacterium sp. WG14 TaxID=2926909 RepID=UPI00211E08A9|nr:hypothetical protein [Chryseobacterium sp. WG14]MCQ9637877.1 hypothetical protein [Chryseobacterium sp. WG14]